MHDIVEKRGALDGIRVLDLTRVLAGPYCTLLLGDMGAEIIKIEVPGSGDDSRKYPPFIGTESAYFMNLNRNKKSLVLNLKDPQGRQVLLDLVNALNIMRVDRNSGISSGHFDNIASGHRGRGVPEIPD